MLKKDKLQKLKRKDLLEVLIFQNTKIKNLEEELKKVKEELEEKEITIKEAGSIAEALLKLNKIFEVAQKTADDYIKNIKFIDNKINQNKKQEYNKKMTEPKQIINNKEKYHE